MSESPAAAREICKACWEIIRVGFTVPDEIWSAAVPERLRESTLCLNCFTRLADEHLLAWDREIAFYPVAFVTHLKPLPGELASKTSPACGKNDSLA